MVNILCVECKNILCFNEYSLFFNGNMTGMKEALKSQGYGYTSFINMVLIALCGETMEYPTLKNGTDEGYTLIRLDYLGCEYYIKRTFKRKFPQQIQTDFNIEKFNREILLKTCVVSLLNMKKGINEIENRKDFIHRIIVEEAREGQHNDNFDDKKIDYNIRPADCCPACRESFKTVQKPINKQKTTRAMLMNYVNMEKYNMELNRTTGVMKYNNMIISQLSKSDRIKAELFITLLLREIYETTQTYFYINYLFFDDTEEQHHVYLYAIPTPFFIFS